MGGAEALPVDLGRRAEQADAERDRLHALLAEWCAQLGSSQGSRAQGSQPPLDVARELVRDHPDGAGVIESARTWTERAIEFTRDHDLVPYHDGVCLVCGARVTAVGYSDAVVGGARRAGRPLVVSHHAAGSSWPQRDQDEWLEMFSHTTLPGITVHEVAPGHFSHGRALRHVTSEVRRTLHSSAFIEGWAHYGEELCVEEGFGAEDPRIPVGVWLEALVRVTRLACAIGVHTAGMAIDDAARRFESDTHLSGPAALSEARRATFDPTYGRYTWGKLGDPQAARAGQERLGRRLHLAALPQGHARPRLPADRAAPHRCRPRLTPGFASGSLRWCTDGRRYSGSRARPCWRRSR